MKSRSTLLAVFTAVIVLTGCTTNNESKGISMGLYKDEEAKRIAHESYDRAMSLWPVPYEEEWIETQYGTSHVIESGPDGAMPVFLLPGLFGDATMWYANLESLAERYRVYCPDLTVTMLDPSETFVRMDGGIAWKGFWNFMVFPNRTKYARFFDWLGRGYSDSRTEIWFAHMLDVIEFGSVGMFDVPQHGIYTNDELGMITMPVLIMAGGKPILFKDPAKFAAAAETALPHAEIEIVPGTGHSLNVEKADEVNERMRRFLDANYR